jgi:hypothetical protein
MRSFVPRDNQSYTPAEFGDRANVGVARALSDPFSILSKLESTVEFPRSEHSIVVPSCSREFLRHLKDMRSRPLNYGWCDRNGAYVLNFRTAEDAVAARLAHEE